MADVLVTGATGFVGANLVPLLQSAGHRLRSRVVEVFRPLRPPMTAQLLRMCPLFFWYSSAKAEAELGYRRGPIRSAIQEAYRWMAAEGHLRMRPRADKPGATA